MKQIPLNHGKVALVDDEDYEFLSGFRWHYKNGYAARNNGRVRVWMHREVMRAEQGQEVDHINRDPLDNQKSNLRFATRKQNADNRGMFRNNTSGYTGVSFHHGKWQASYRHNGLLVYLGRYETAEDAHKAYMQFKLSVTQAD